MMEEKSSITSYKLYLFGDPYYKLPKKCGFTEASIHFTTIFHPLPLGLLGVAPVKQIEHQMLPLVSESHHCHMVKR